MSEQSDADTKSANPIDQSVPPFIKAYIDQQIEDSKKDKNDTRKKKWQNSWRSASPITKGTFVLTAFMSGSTVIYAIVAIFQIAMLNSQMAEMHSATQASEHAVQVANDALTTSSSQFDRSMRQTITQTISAIDSSRAAKQAAEISNETLHISERAYLNVAEPTVDYDSKALIYRIINSGHIPSGDTVTLEHVVIMTPERPGDTRGSITAKYWLEKPDSTVPVGDVFDASLVLPGLDKSRMEQGLQSFFVVGTISYNDGFPDTPTRTDNFCIIEVWDANSKTVQLKSCPFRPFVAKAVKADGYPDPTYKYR